MKRASAVFGIVLFFSFGCETGAPEQQVETSSSACSAQLGTCQGECNKARVACIHECSDAKRDCFKGDGTVLGNIFSLLSCSSDKQDCIRECNRQGQTCMSNCQNSGSGGSGSGGVQGSGGTRDASTSLDAATDPLPPPDLAYYCMGSYCWCPNSTAESARCCNGDYQVVPPLTPGQESKGSFVRLKSDSRVFYPNTFVYLGYYYVSEDSLRTWLSVCGAPEMNSFPPNGFVCGGVSQVIDEYIAAFHLKQPKDGSVVPPRPGTRIICKLVDGGEACYVLTRDFVLHELISWDLAEVFYGSNAESLKVFLPETTMAAMKIGSQVTAVTVGDGGTEAIEDGGIPPLERYDPVAECQASSTYPYENLQTFLNKLP